MATNVGLGKAVASALTSRVDVDGVSAEATLSEGGSEIRWRFLVGRGGERCLSVESDVLSAEADGRRIRVRAFVSEVTGIYCGRKSYGKRSRREFVLSMPNEDSAALWTQRIDVHISSLGRPRRLYIILNPFGGKRSARKIFQNEVKPLLEASGLLYTLQETQCQLHAQEIAQKLDVMKYDGIVCVSGDGVLVEVVNGLLQRVDWETAIKVPLGIIPAGTGNGMAKSLLDEVGEAYSVSNAVFAIIKGGTRPLDVTAVVQKDKRFFSVLMLTWGFGADVDIESEKYRWMGSARLEFYTLVRTFNLRKYNGRIQFVPAPGYEIYGEPCNEKEESIWKSRLPEDSFDNSACSQKLAGGYQGPSTYSMDGMEWRTIDGPFTMVWLNNVPWSGEGILAAPKAKFADGFLDVVIIKDCPIPAFFSALLKMRDGSHVKSPYVTYLKVKSFRLEPGERVGEPGKGGIVDSDGEVIARGRGTYVSSGHYQQEEEGDGARTGALMAYGPPIIMNVHKGFATVFSPKC